MPRRSPATSYMLTAALISAAGNQALHKRIFSPRGYGFDRGRLEDALDGFIQQGVKLGVGLLRRQPVEQRPRKTRNDAVISPQEVVGFITRVAARQGDHPQDFGVLDKIGVEIVL